MTVQSLEGISSPAKRPALQEAMQSLLTIIKLTPSQPQPSILMSQSSDPLMSQSSAPFMSQSSAPLMSQSSAPLMSQPSAL